MEIKYSQYIISDTLKNYSINEALDKMFIAASEYYEVELNNSTEGLSALMEPVITVVMGVFIAIFVGSVFIPMFKMYENVAM